MNKEKFVKKVMSRLPYIQRQFEKSDGEVFPVLALMVKRLQDNPAAEDMFAGFMPLRKQGMSYREIAMYGIGRVVAHMDTIQMAQLLMEEAEAASPTPQ